VRKPYGRGMRHSQVPVLQRQMLAHRALALAVEEGVEGLKEDGDNLGFVLASNMNAGFAIELGLKAFYMSFHAKGPPATHDLFKLYEALPEHLREDIDTRYRRKVQGGPDIRVFAFKFSPEELNSPSADEGPNYLSTEGCLNGCASVFVRARYFFEDLNAVEWTVIESPVFYMVRMVDALDEAYEHAFSQATVTSTD
jgi:hypothetical protein